LFKTIVQVAEPGNWSLVAAPPLKLAQTLANPNLCSV